MGVVVHHRAASRRDLGKPVWQHASDKANIGWEGGIDVRLQDLRNGCHGSFLHRPQTGFLTWHSSRRALAKRFSASINSVMSARTCSKPGLFSKVCWSM